MRVIIVTSTGSTGAGEPSAAGRRRTRSPSGSASSSSRPRCRVARTRCPTPTTGSPGLPPRKEQTQLIRRLALRQAGRDRDAPLLERLYLVLGREFLPPPRAFAC